MKSIRVKNFKSFKDSGIINLRALNVFIGKNSSGKSTLLRTLPLFKQTFERPIKDPILWYGDYVDFGSFNNSINSKHSPSDNTISFSFGLLLSQSRYYFSQTKDTPTDAFITLEISEHRIEKYSLLIDNHTIDLIADNKQKRFNILLDGSDSKGLSLPISLNNFLLVSYDMNDILSRDKYFSYFRASDLVFQEIKSFVPIIFDDAQRKNTLNKMLKKLGKERNYNQDNINNLENDLIKRAIYELINNSYETLASESSGVQYFQPVRSRGDRFYRVQGIRIDEVDSNGNNGPMVLYSMSQADRDSFEEWCLSNLGFSFCVENIGASNESASVCVFDKNGNKHNMTDVGFGYSQIFPIILSIWKTSNPKLNKNIYVRASSEPIKTIVIEQPELHLHPAFQQKIIKLILKLINSPELRDKIMFVIETHSETIINYLGKAIIKKELNNNDLNIFVCDKINDFTEITEMKFNDNGLIQNWPIGFFSDEE